MTALRTTLAAVVVAVALAVLAGVVSPVPAPAVTGAPAATQAPSGGGAGGEAGPMMLVVDTSGSMGDDDGTGRLKIEGARAAMLNFVGGLPTDAALGLRTYPRGDGGCDDGSQLVSPGVRNPATVAARIRSLSPDGDTPTAEALEAAVADLEGAGYTGGTLILVSDGQSTCEDPCPIAEGIARGGIALTVITVGFQISDGDAVNELRCIAEATEGTYVDAADTAALDTVLGELTRPQLQIGLEHPDSVVADVGVGQGLVTITATITNVGSTDARAVTAQLRFDLTGSPGVAAPYRVLGNLAAGSQTVVRWQFQAGLILAGKTMAFSIIVRGRDLAGDISASGEIEILNEASQSNAGPLLSGAQRVVVMGDSYSSGEGVGDYLQGTDTIANPCHRSRLTHTATAFPVADGDILACSGAVSRHITVEKQHGQDPQVDQLRTRQREGRAVDAVVLTTGGNDIGFGTVGVSCLFGFACEATLGYPLVAPGGILEQSDAFLEPRLEALTEALPATYRAIHNTVNSAEEIRRRNGRIAPIIVLGYPRILPGIHTAGCLSGSLDPRSLGPLSVGPVPLTDDVELAFLTHTVTELNGAIEGAIHGVARNIGGLPVTYVPTIEDSFLPDHTVCAPDGQEWANGLDDLDVDLDLTNIGPIPGLFRALIQAPAAWRAKQEVLHPNTDGYAAMTRALIRFTQTDEANALAERLQRPGSFSPATGSGAPSTTRAGPLQAGGGPASVRPGTTAQVRGDGFAPGMPVLVTMFSTPTALGEVTADEDGNVELDASITDDIAVGDHQVVLLGLGPTGEPHSQEIPVEVEGAGEQPVLVAGVGVLIAGLGAVLARVGRRRRTGAT